MITDLLDENTALLNRHRESMRRQGLVGWVLHHPLTGIALHLYQTLKSAEAAVPSLNARHGVSFRVLAVSAQGFAYEHVDGKAARRAVDPHGVGIRIPLHGRRIDRRGVRHFVPVDARRAAAG